MPISDEMTQLVNQKAALLHDAWLSRIGHKRPGMAAGLSLDEAKANAVEIDKQLERLIMESRKPVASN